MPDRDVKVRFTGDGSQLGAESKKMVSSLNEVKGAAQTLFSAFVGGAIGGGIGGAVQSAVSLIAKQIQDARALAREARGLGLTDTFLSGAKTLGSILFDQKDLIPSAVATARQKRSDAMADDESALRSLARLGLTKEGIAGLSADELFDAIVRAFQKGPDTRERRVAVGDLFGDEQANKLIPYLIGGKNGQYDLFALIKSLGKDPTIDLPGYGFARDSIRKNLDENYRGGTEPLSRANIGSAERTENLKRENDQRALHNARERMTIEERIASIDEERARLQAKMSAESNEEKQQKIRTDILQLDAERNHLERNSGASGKEGAARRASALRNFTPDADEFTQRGIYIGGASQGAAILQVQVTKLERLVQLAEQQVRDNAKNWGD
ncbi:MAG: hypothetical protein U1G08_19955 [Verrucomicrobiota bacterium]